MLNRLCWISLVGLVATMLVQTPTVVWAQAKGDAAAATPQLKFEVYQDAQSQYRWRLVNGEGKDRQVLATGGQGYKAKADCMHGVHEIRIGLELTRLHPGDCSLRGRREIEPQHDEVEGEKQAHDGRGDLKRHRRLLSMIRPQTGVCEASARTRGGQSPLTRFKPA